jgi:hypothetical protein
MTETSKTVQEAWAAVMADVQSLGKNQAVTSGPARFRFRGVDDVMNAVGPALRTHGVSVMPVQVHSTAENLVTKSGAHMRNVTVFVQYAITGPDGSVMPGAAAGEAADAGDKATPKAMSVAFRTFLLQALCLPTDEPDPDEQQYERAAAPQQQYSQPPNTNLDDIPMTEKTRSHMFGLFHRKGIPEHEQLSGINHITGSAYDSRGKVTEGDALRVIAVLETRPDANPANQANVQ